MAGLACPGNSPKTSGLSLINFASALPSASHSSFLSASLIFGPTFTQSKNHRFPTGGRAQTKSLTVVGGYASQLTLVNFARVSGEVAR